jgi:chitosanase
MSGQIPKPTRSLALATTLLVWGMGIAVPSNTARADDCLTAPNSPAPAGSYWYYRTDRATQRKCWHVRATDRPAEQAAEQSPSDAAEKPATVSTGMTIPGDSTNTARADDCLTAPNSPAPAGSHWYYRTDRATQRQCWYVRATDQPAEQVAGQSPSDAAEKPATVSTGMIIPGDGTPPLPRIKTLALKPQRAPRNSATMDQPVQQNTQNGSPASPVPPALGRQVNPASSIPEARAPQGRLQVTTAVGQTPLTRPSADTLPPAWKSCAEQMTNIFENESISLKYDEIEDLNDGDGYTAGRAGFTTKEGDLLQVVEVYDGIRPNNVLSGFIPILKEVRETASIRGLGALPAAWKKAASDPLFRQAQDQVSDKLYYTPAMEAADDLHLQSPLAKFALYDAIIQHGTGDDPDSLGGIIRAATRAARGPPYKAGEEKWLMAFLTARREVLLNAADPETRAAWKASVGRVNEQLRLLKERNLQLSPPLTLNPYGTEFTVNCAIP